MTATAVAHPPARARRAPASHFRPDVQGLRAVAVGSVLLYHAGVPWVSGGYVGVDVFFVISGFLITGLLLRECLDTGRISLTGFYARRVRRILPAATLVLLVVATATVLVLPATRWQNIGQEVLGSALYYVNWVFAADANYLNAEVPPSPLQHFWTLAVEEQFYLVWPALLVVLIAAAGRRARRTGVRHPGPDVVRRRFLLGALLITLPSFAWSVHLTRVAPEPAYFVTTTRLWELGVGACVAVLAHRLQRLPHAARVAAGWVGLATVAAACVLLSRSTPYPGSAALVPTLGAALVVVGGLGGTAGQGAGRLLSVRPMTVVGDLSYSLYLWHWPMVVIGTYLLGGDLAVWQGLAIVTLSAVPAALSYHYVERPFLDWRRLRRSTPDTLMLGGVMVLTSAVAGMLVLVVVKPATSTWSASVRTVTQDADGRGADPVGAALLQQDPSVGRAADRVERIVPPPAAAASDVGPQVGQGCHQEVAEDLFEACTFGDPDGPVVALVGDSHAGQWVPALLPVAEAAGWRLDVHTKSSCPLVDEPVLREGQPYDACTRWNARALEALTGPDRPDRVVVTASAYRAAAGDDVAVLAAGLARAWRALLDAGVEVTVLLDTPYAGFDVPECVAVNDDALTRCALPRESALAANGSAALRRAAQAVGIEPVDLTPLVCPGDPCAPVVGGVLVYRDSNHLTATYAASLAPALEAELTQQGVPGLGGS